MNKFYVMSSEDMLGRQLCRIHITSNDKYYYTHHDIITLLELPIKQYYTLIDDFEALPHYTGIVFDNLDKAEKLASYLNHKYLLVLKLQGKV